MASTFGKQAHVQNFLMPPSQPFTATVMTSSLTIACTMMLLLLLRTVTPIGLPVTLVV
jgi:hypothetical protein